MNQIKHIPLEKLLPPAFDQRLSTSPQEDKELMESIRELGILEPLIVKDTDHGFEIVVGHRRFTQAGIAGLTAAPCIVVKSDEAGFEKIKLHENLHRLPLSHVDQAYTFAHFIKVFKMTEKQISTLVGKSIAYVSQHLSLLSCDDTLLQAVHDGRINFSVARELFQCKDKDEKLRLTEIIEENGASVKVVNGWVQESNRETEKIDDQIKPQTSNYPAQEPDIPMYPCAICKTPADVRELQIVRMCPDCKHTIFSEIEHQQMEHRREIATKASEPA